MAKMFLPVGLFLYPDKHHRQQRMKVMRETETPQRNEALGESGETTVKTGN